MPALEASRSYCVRTDGQTNRLRARGARGSPWGSPARLGLGGTLCRILSRTGPRGQGLRGSVMCCSRKTGNGAGGRNLFHLAFHVPVRG